MLALGLDLGVGSVGWALVDVDAVRDDVKLVAIGSRIVNLADKEESNFQIGKSVTACSQRTVKRTARKLINRFQQRRASLIASLTGLGMIDHNNRMLNLDPVEIWQLRADAATPGHRLTLVELGRVLLHLNQKRGYRHAKSDVSDSRQTEYVQNVNNNFARLQDLGKTPGQYYADCLKKSAVRTEDGAVRYEFRIKGAENVLPRQAYELEFDRIMDVQRTFYPDVLTDHAIADLKNIIYYQRPLKSCKHLVSACEFMAKKGISKDGVEFVMGPKVAPRTSPLAQVERIYEAINNLRIFNPANKKRTRRAKDNQNQQSHYDGADLFGQDERLSRYEYKMSNDERNRVFDYLNKNEKLTQSKLLDLLGLKGSGFRTNITDKRGIQGNTTFVKLSNALIGLDCADKLLKFNIDVVDSNKADQDTGEVIKVVSPDYNTQPLYRLWHLVYSISNRTEFEKALVRNYGTICPGITNSEVINRLFAIDFVKDGFSNKSAKFMRYLLPYLMEGLDYATASVIVGVNHSDSLTAEENENRPLKDRLANLRKGELRQPTVEKVLNQMINIVNALRDKYGYIDEIRVELARELKQSKDERAEMTKALSKREKENVKIADIIASHGLRPSRRNIQKYRLWQESGNCCVYCGRVLSISEFLGGHGGEIEHIVPRSLLFDDSFSNKACSCVKCNRDKGQQTAYDFMSSKTDNEFNQYIARVQDLYDNRKISKTKYTRLRTSKEEIPTDFLERDLRQSQYIAKKAREILREVCRNVYASTGSVTDFLRHNWGYDMILHNLNLNRYEMAGLVEDFTYEHDGQMHTERRIADWNKRLDHRHHAIDALVIALTRQSYIQRLNNLNGQRDNMFADLNSQSDDYKERFHLLEKWAETRPHIPVADVACAADSIAVSFKAGKKLTTPGKCAIIRNNRRNIVQSGLVIPRGSLHEETVYGKIKCIDKGVKITQAFMKPHIIINSDIRNQVEDRIAMAGGDVAKAIKELKKNPILWGKDKEPLTVVDCFSEEYVVRYKIESIEYKNINDIVDEGIRRAVRERYELCGKDQKKFQASIAENPITIGKKTPMPVKTVRCFTGLKESSMVTVRKDSLNNNIGFAKTGNNHHVAFYRNADGKIETFVTSFWTAVRRKMIQLPAIITDPAGAWDHIFNLPESETVAEVASSLPAPDLTYVGSMRRNEMFIMGLSEDQLNDAVANNDLKTITAHLYRVQKLAFNDYYFRLHTATTVGESKAEKDSRKYLRTSYKSFTDLNPCKVRVNPIGEITILSSGND